MKSIIGAFALALLIVCVAVPNLVHAHRAEGSSAAGSLKFVLDDASLKWVATDAELKDDVGIQVPMSKVVACQSFPLASYDFPEIKEAGGDLTVQR